MLALAAQVNQALRLADSLQRQFQCAPFTGPSAMLEHRVLQLRTQHKKLQMEYDRIMEDAAASLSSPEGKCLTHAFEDLSVEVERVVWYEEDAVAHGCTIAVLQQRNEELEGRAARVEETSDRLRRELDDVSEAFLHAMNDVVSLRNELSELRDAHKLQEDNSAAKIAYWREQTQKWMNTASKEAVSPYNLSKLLTDGDDAVKHKALRRLRAHAERAPQHLVQTKGVLLALVNAACEDQEHAVIAIQALACTAHADYKAHFRYVPNLAERLHSIARDDDKRKAALAPFIKLVAFLTQGHGPGILDCAQERTLFSATLVQLWREIHPSDPLMREVACALAHLTKIDAVGMASPFIAQTLEVYLTRHDKIWGGMLLSLSNLVHLTPVRKLVEGNNALQANLILFIQGKSVYERAVRISASRVLEKLCQAHNGHRLVLSMQPFPHLFAMMRTDDVEEYESCMKVLTLLMSDDGFCHRVMRNDDFALTVISRSRTSDIAMFLLTEMTLRCATLLEDRLKQKQKEGAKLEPPDSPFASRNLYLHHLISLDAGLTDTINAHLFTNASHEAGGPLQLLPGRPVQGGDRLPARDHGLFARAPGARRARAGDRRAGSDALAPAPDVHQRAPGDAQEPAAPHGCRHSHSGPTADAADRTHRGRLCHRRLLGRADGPAQHVCLQQGASDPRRRGEGAVQRLRHGAV